MADVNGEAERFLALERELANLRAQNLYVEKLLKDSEEKIDAVNSTQQELLLQRRWNAVVLRALQWLIAPIAGSAIGAVARSAWEHVNAAFHAKN